MLREEHFCVGCFQSFCASGNDDKSPYCKAVRMGKTDDKKVEELMKRVEANDAGSTYLLGNYYYHGKLGLL